MAKPRTMHTPATQHPAPEGPPQDHLAFLLAASEVLASSLDYTTTLTNVANLAVWHRFADWCAVYLREDDGSIVPAAVAHVDPTRTRWAQQLLERYPPQPDDDYGVAQVLKTGQPVCAWNVDAGLLKSVARDREHLRLLRQVGMVSGVIVALEARGKVLGAMSLVRTRESQTRFHDGDLPVAVDLARRAALAIDNARLHREARESLQRLGLALEAGRMGTWEWNIKTGAVRWSPQLEAVHGYEAGSFAGTVQAFLAEIHPDDRERVRQAVRRVVETRQRHLIEYRIVRPDGSVRWLLGRGEIVEVDPEGRPLRMAGVCADITERKRGEQRLEHALKTLQAVIHASPLPVVVMDLKGCVTEWNPAAERITGWRREEVLGRLNPMFPDTRHGRDDQLLARLMRGESLDGVVVQRRRKDRKLVDLGKWAAPLCDGAGQVYGYVAIYMDVTDRVRFLRVATHELANPFASIKAMCSLLAREVERTTASPRLRQRVERLEREVERFWALLDDVITAFKSHQGRLSVEPALIDLRSVVRNSVEGFPDSGHRLVMDLPAERVPVWGDRRRLEQVLGNLLGNAAKYSSSGTCIRVVLSVTGDRALLSVSDEGVGIPESELPRIFEEFYRVEGRGPNSDAGSVAHGTQGLGLGLFICREIVLQHGGRIWVESRPGTGSTFYVELPCAADRPGRQPARPS